MRGKFYEELSRAERDRRELVGRAERARLSEVLEPGRRAARVTERSLAAVGVLWFVLKLLREDLLGAERPRSLRSKLRFFFANLSLDLIGVEALRELGELEDLGLDEVVSLGLEAGPP